MADELYSLEVCAKKAGVSVSTIKRELVAGRLAATRLRGRVKIHPQDWEAYLQKCRSAGTGKDGKSGFNGEVNASADLSAAVATLPNLSAALSKGSKIVALDERRSTRSKKRLTAG